MGQHIRFYFPGIFNQRFPERENRANFTLARTLVFPLLPLLHDSGSYFYYGPKGAFFNPADVTACLGVTPTRTWQKGDLSDGDTCWQFSGWELSTAQSPEPLDIY